MNTRRPIIITGFMAAGKTTVARALARLLSCEAADLDDVVEAREGRPPRRLIDEDGESAFRDAETRALSDLLDRRAARVVALGGGTFALERNRALLNEHDCLTVWLDAPFELCWQRITHGGGDARPLARDRESAQRLYDERLASYQLADARVRITEGRSPEGLAAEIAESARARA